MLFLVVGCGSIGKRHIRNLKILKTSALFDLETVYLHAI